MRKPSSCLITQSRASLRNHFYTQARAWEVLAVYWGGDMQCTWVLLRLTVPAMARLLTSRLWL